MRTTKKRYSRGLRLAVTTEKCLLQLTLQLLNASLISLALISLHYLKLQRSLEGSLFLKNMQSVFKRRQTISSQGPIYGGTKIAFYAVPLGAIQLFIIKPIHRLHISYCKRNTFDECLRSEPASAKRPDGPNTFETVTYADESSSNLLHKSQTSQINLTWNTKFHEAQYIRTVKQ